MCRASSVTDVTDQDGCVSRAYAWTRRENPPRQGFFEHPEYLAVRAHLPAPWQDILDLAYYSGWRKNEILGLTWDEIDEAGGVIRLSPARSKTLVGRILPISQPIADALARRRARRDPTSPLVFHRDGIPVRRWRTAWRTACQAAGVPTRFLHDCRRTAARTLIRASVPERVDRGAFSAQAAADRRAPLRGGASHETEGRRGARDSGTGRVRAPAGRLRLCVLLQVGDQLVAGLEQFLLVDDVVAVEDSAGLAGPHSLAIMTAQ